MPARNDSGLPQPRRERRRSPAIAGLLAIVIATAGSACTISQHRAAACPQLVLNIAAAPAIAPAAQATAASYNATNPKPGGYCVRVDVRPAQPSAVANSLSGEGVITSAARPDGWVPDSTLWIDQARSTAAGAARVSAAGPSVAMSPIVLALPSAAAARLAASHRPLSWRMLVPKSLPTNATPGSPAEAAAQALTGLPFRLKILDPAVNSAGMASMLALRTVVGHGQAGLVTFVMLARVAQFITAPTDLALVRAMFTGSRPTAGVIPEQVVWQHNKAHPGQPLAAVYPREGSPALDFPLVATTADPAKKLAVAAFAQAMSAPSAQQAIRAQGLRTPDGVAAPAFGPALGLSQQPPAQIPLPSVRVANAVRQMWARVLIGARMLIVFDVSPSMGQLVPGTNVTRLQAMTQLNAQGISLFDESDVIGLWTFDTGLADPFNYRVVLPMRPLNQKIGTSTQRDLILGALAGVRPEVDTVTALYATILSAFREVTRGYTPDRFNGVVIDTDGMNFDPRPNALSLRRLVSALRQEFDPQRPVNVLIIGYGHSVDFPALEEVAKATDGAVYEADSPAAVAKFYLQVLTRLVCNGSCPLP